MTRQISILIPAFFLITILNIQAQRNTLFMLYDVPQSISLNPAIQYPCNKFIELPVISSLMFAYNNSSFSYTDLIHPGPGNLQDSLVMDIDNIASQTMNKNFISTDFEFVIFGLGLRRNEYYFTFNIKNKTLGRLDYTKSLIDLRNGNWNSTDDTPIQRDLTGNGIGLLNYTEFSIGISKPFAKNLVMGMKLKYLKGALNLQTKKSDFTINTGDRPLSLTFLTNYQINASMPLNLTYDSTGMVESAEYASGNLLKTFLFNSNNGVAIDWGIIYELDPKIQLSASVLDAGFIFWKSNVSNFMANGSATFSGFDLNRYEDGLINPDLRQAIKDTLQNSFRWAHSEDSYMTLLPLRVMAGAKYLYNQKIELGLAGNVQFYNFTINPTLTSYLSYKPVDYINLVANWSFVNRELDVFGLGVVLGKGPLQFYFVSENIPINYVKFKSGAFLPLSDRSFNFHFGINLIYGCDNKYNKNSRKSLCPAYKGS
jgi:hypothetical protein